MDNEAHQEDATAPIHRRVEDALWGLLINPYPRAGEDFPARYRAYQHAHDEAVAAVAAASGLSVREVADRVFAASRAIL